MKILWCWRCKMDIPMLDEDEFDCIREADRSLGKNDTDNTERSLREYERITGFSETNRVAIEHHRIFLYGPPCSKCGKPLRSPQAKLCGACMAPVR